ncbi:hypothetical protein ACFYPG_22415 [Micromonospora sp. NPDC005553]|uniref:hypothetical protein n=1 Tax=Micromonospora sp. NPDC005553 TaxID=3364232 RepID=UPI0036A9768A
MPVTLGVQASVAGADLRRYTWHAPLGQVRGHDQAGRRTATADLDGIPLAVARLTPPEPSPQISPVRNLIHGGQPKPKLLPDPPHHVHRPTPTPPRLLAVIKKFASLSARILTQTS